MRRTGDGGELRRSGTATDRLASATEAGVTRTFGYNTDGDTTARGADTLAWDGWGATSAAHLAARA